MSNNLDSMQSTVDNRTSLMNGGIADDILQQHRGRGPPGHPPGGGPPSPPQPLLQQQQQQHTINEITNKHQVCDSDWGLPQGGGGNSPPGLPHHSNSTSIKDSYKPQPEMSMPPISSALPADLFEEDDLGFDPFHETQKALAEMLESESKVQAELQKQLQEQRQQQQQIQQQQQQQQNHNNQAQQQPHRHLYQHQASTGQIPNFPNSQNQRLNDDTSPPLQQLRHESPVMNRAPIGTSGGSSGGGGGSSSLMAGLRGFTNDLVQQTSIAGGSGGLPNHMNSASNSTAGGPPGLRKQPPPGFDPLSMLNSGSSNGQHSSQRNLLSPGKKNIPYLYIKVRKSWKQ